MSLDAILSHIQELVSAVPQVGAGRVHKGLRQFRTVEQWLAAAQDPTWTIPHNHIWFVTRGVTPETPSSTGSNLRTHRLTLAGYYQMFDSGDDPSVGAELGTVMLSETSFSEVVEKICKALRNDGALHGGALSLFATPPQVTVWVAKQMFQKDHHYAEISLQVGEEVLVAFTE